MSSTSSVMNTPSKKTRIEDNRSCTCITSLPKQLLVEIVARVGSDSVIDLLSVKQCCKALLDAGDDSHMWQQVCLNEFPIYQWIHSDEALVFLERCRDSRNPDSLFRDGFVEFFKWPKGNIDGLEKLKMAATKGQIDAKYVYGLILLTSEDDDLRKEGLEHMRFLRKSKCIVKCRTSLERYLSQFWASNGLIVRNPTPLCASKNTCKGWRPKHGVWILILDEHDDVSLCEMCRWDDELRYFYDLNGLR